MDQAKRWLKDNGLRWKNFVNAKEMEYGIEKRMLPTEFRVKTEDGQEVVDGQAAVAESWSEDLGGFREMIMPGAFMGADISDVRVLKNHNPDYILGRTTAGTAKVVPTERALVYSYVDGGTSYGKDLLISMRRGDVSQSSFAFRVKEGGDKWEKAADGKYERRIHAFSHIYDVSPVTFPAYPDTTVAKRSLDGLQSAELEEAKRIEAEQRAAEQAEKDQLEAEQTLREIELKGLSDNN